MPTFFSIKVTTFYETIFLISFPQMYGPDNVDALHNIKNAIMLVIVALHSIMLNGTEGNTL